jgi:hypothetical protein
MSNLASPLYSKTARFLKKDWVVRKKQLMALEIESSTIPRPNRILFEKIMPQTDFESLLKRSRMP